MRFSVMGNSDKPVGFANMLITIVTDNRLPDLPFLKGEDNYEIQN